MPTWDKTYRPKGGIGIRRIKDMVAAFLTKQGWKVFTQSDNIWVGIAKAKYNNNSKDNFFSNRNYTASLAWISILDHRNLIKRDIK